MKKFIKLMLVLSGVMVIIPLFVLFLPREADSVSVLQTETVLLNRTADGDLPEVYYITPDTIRILDEGSGAVTAVPMTEYVIGAVMAEMPADFPEEALKAQAAAVRTYAIRAAVKARGWDNVSDNNTENYTNSNINGNTDSNAADMSEGKTDSAYDISNASGEFIPYWNETQGRAFYAGGYDRAYERIAAAVRAVSDYALVYEGEPIAAAYHSASSGRTESAENVWGNALPYLQSVKSPGDIDAPVYQDVVTFTEKELRARLETEVNAVFDNSGDAATWLAAESRSESGTVLKLRAGDTVITGQEFRRIFGLRSAAFYISVKDGVFTIVTRGYGHGAGMSQYGAKAMAEEGSTWEEIVKHYYTGIEIVKTSAF
jgi:stage II sporulation protein D